MNYINSSAWKAEWVAVQGATDYGRHPAHH